VEKKNSATRQATDDNIPWRMRFACPISKDTNTHLEYTECFRRNRKYFSRW